MKKMMCIAMVLVLLCGTHPVFGQENSGNTGVLMLTPEEAQAEYERLLREGIIEEEVPQIMPASTIVDDSYLVYPVGVRQSNGYYCGPAAVLQALYASSDAYGVPGANDTAKQKTLASSSYLRTDIDQATSIYNMPATLQAFSGNTWKLMHVSNSNPSYNIYTSHEKNNAVIYLVNTESLDYYNEDEYIHYITGTGIYFDANTYATTANTRVRLQDPHYSDAYYGDHTVTMDNLIEALSEISYHNLVYCN